MAIILARTCPRCRDYLAVVIGEPKGREKSQPITGRFAVCGYEIPWPLIPGYCSVSRPSNAKLILHTCLPHNDRECSYSKIRSHMLSRHQPTSLAVQRNKFCHPPV